MIWVMVILAFSAKGAPVRQLAPLPPQLFNIELDPSVSEDFSDRYPKRIGKMLTELEAWFYEFEAERSKITE